VLALNHLGLRYLFAAKRSELVESKEELNRVIVLQLLFSG
jgi:hypothetical protein